MEIKQIIRAPGGRNRRIVAIEDVKVPDLWHVAEKIGLETPMGKDVLECWHLAHDLLANIKAYNEGKEL